MDRVRFWNKTEPFPARSVRTHHLIEPYPSPLGWDWALSSVCPLSLPGLPPAAYKDLRLLLIIRDSDQREEFLIIRPARACLYPKSREVRTESDQRELFCPNRPKALRLEENKTQKITENHGKHGKTPKNTKTTKFRPKTREF